MKVKNLVALNFFSPYISLDGESRNSPAYWVDGSTEKGPPSNDGFIWLFFIVSLCDDICVFGEVSNQVYIVTKPLLRILWAIIFFFMYLFIVVTLSHGK